MSDYARVFVLILNTNRREDTLNCLRSLSASTYPALDVVVLENGSTDGSVEAICEQFPTVKLLPLSENKGYAGNNNSGIEYALQNQADWVLVLNEDTTMTPDTIRLLVDTAGAETRIGIAGPLVLHQDEPEVIQSAGMMLDPLWRSYHLGQNEPDRGQFAEPRAVMGISGCAILLRAEMLRQVGAFDERFFYYYEETELCLRALNAGWKIVLEPRARLWHSGVKRDYRPGPNISYYKTRNHLIMLEKHHAPFSVKLRNWLDDLRTVAAWTLKPRWRATQKGHRDATLQGMRDYLAKRYGMR